MKTLFRHPQFSPRTLPFALLLCFAFGCANVQKRGTKQYVNKPGQAKAAETGDEAEDEMSGLVAGAPLKAFRINPDYGWVVVRSANTLIPGQRFSAWHGDEETAQLVVDERSRHPYYILEVTAGEPHPDDTYTPATE